MTFDRPPVRLAVLLAPAVTFYVPARAIPKKTEAYRYD
jgi:hypothetical protein